MTMGLRVLNGIFWLYLWLSDAIQPGGDWPDKLFRLNSHIDDSYRFVGNAIIPLVLWFVIDTILRRAVRAKARLRKIDAN
jgi:hypothetical protein